MARLEKDREDLLREATALRRRAELLIQEYDEPIVVGFRQQGAAGLYLGQDHVFQFESAGRWRRGYFGGCLLKAVDGKIYSLRRVRQPHQVELRRQSLSAEQERAYREVWCKVRHHLCVAIERGHFRLVGQHPPSPNLPEEILCWLNSMPEHFLVALAPGVR